VVSFARGARLRRAQFRNARWGLPIAGCFWALPALALPTVHQECKALSAEDSARVEARLLASLLSPEAGDVDVSIACSGGIASVSASVGSPEVRRSVALSGVVAPDAILTLAMRAVTQVLATGLSSTEVSRGDGVSEQGTSSPATSPAVTESAAKPCEPEPSAKSAPPARAPVAEPARSHHESRIRADFALESWGSHAAGAALVGLEQRAGRWSYAFLAGLARPFQQPSLSDATEWMSAAELGWFARDWLGLRFSTRLGFSLLTANPHEGVTTNTGILKSAGFLELDVARPIWLGRFGFAPGVGLRVFSAKRAITIDGESELQLSTPSFHAFIAMLFRVSE